MARKYVFTLLSFLLSNISFAQLSVNTTMTPAQLVALLTGTGVTISNVQYTGSPLAIGQFNAVASNLGLSSGMMLTTADCGLSVGPNNSTGASNDLGEPGDPYLDLVTGSTTFDAAILEFDFVPQSDTVRFRYVFGSEEYPEYVCSIYNDAFAFLISGPGYATPTNIALIPGSTASVAINTVNIGATGTAGGTGAATCDLTHASLYVDNTFGTTVQLDGFTVPLYAVAAVTPCRTYHLRIVIADAGDGWLDSSVFFEQGSLSSDQVVDAGPDRTVCSGDTVHLGFPGTAGWSYAWYPVTGINNPFIPNPVFTVGNVSSATTSTYILASSYQSCVLRDTVVITASPRPIAQFSTTDVCVGANPTVTFTGTAPQGSVYNWNFGGGTVVSGSGAGPYTLSYPTAGNQTISLQINYGACNSLPVQQSLNIFQGLTATVNATDLSCYQNSNGVIAITPTSGQGAYQYNWTPSVSNTNTASNLAAGNYSVVVTDANGCTTTTTATLTEPTPITAAAAGSAPQCAGTPSGIAFASASGGTSPLSFFWPSNNSANDSLTNLVSGNYTCVITDQHGCSTSVTATVPPSTFVQVQLTNSAPDICPNQPVDLTASGGNQIVWSTGATGPVLNVSPSVSTQYSVTITDQNGCTGTATTAVTVHPLPVPDFISDTVCVGKPTKFENRSSIASGIIMIYEWRMGDGTILPSVQASYTYPSAGDYNVQLITTSDFGCTDSVLLRAKVWPKPEAVFSSGPREGCSPVTVDFQPVSIVPDATIAQYTWTFRTIGNTNDSMPSQEFTGAGTYDVALSIISTNGCTDDTIVRNYVTVYPNPVADFSIVADGITELMPDAKFVDLSQDALNWFWDFGDSTYSTEREPAHRYNGPGIYAVLQMVNNRYGCVDTIARLLDVGKEFAVWIPSAFTPNGDGVNDQFVVKGFNFTDYRIEIYNRWGRSIYVSNDPNTGWDGNFKGDPSQEGVFNYVVDYKDAHLRTHREIGKVTLVR